MADKTIEEIIGDPRQIDADLREFRKNARVLSSKSGHLLEKYPKRWVAIYGRRILADEDTLGQLLARVDEMNVPRDRVVTRFIDKNQRRMIL